MSSDASKGGNMAKKNTSPAPTVRPEELANELGLSGKIVRSYLRANFTRPAEAKNTAWVLTADQAANVREHFESRRAKANA
jgi:hypothetical protein